MKLAIMQPYFFPYIGYFQLINAVDKFIFYDDVAYIKQGWINRNNVLINDKPTIINLPIRQASSFKYIKDIELFKYNHFAAKIIKSIELNYKNSPYYYEVMTLIEHIMKFKEWGTISEFNIHSITQINSYLKIHTTLAKSSEAKYNTRTLKGQERVISICLQEGATSYINPIGGQELYSHDDFDRVGVNLSFLKSNNVTYHQFNKTILPNLSIVDVLMFNSADKIKNDLLNRYELIS